MDLNAHAGHRYRCTALATAVFMMSKALEACQLDDTDLTEECLRAARLATETYHAITLVWPTSSASDEAADDDSTGAPVVIMSDVRAGLQGERRAPTAPEATPHA